MRPDPANDEAIKKNAACRFWDFCEKSYGWCRQCTMKSNPPSSDVSGFSRLIVDSILARDYAVVQGCLLFTALVYVLVNLAVDLCYPLLDPRVTVEG